MTPVACRALTGAWVLALALWCAAASALPPAESTALTEEQEAALRAIARGRDAAWSPMDAGQAQYLHEKAERYFRQYREHHLPHGLNVDVWWVDHDRSAVRSYEGLADSALWTGHYMAALALRYSIEPSEDLRDALLDALYRYDILSQVTGRRGAYARYAGPADDAAYREYYHKHGGRDRRRPGLGRRAFRGQGPFSDLVWLGRSSRDTYTGVCFGLATTWAYVDDPEVRARVKVLVERIGDTMIADNYWIRDGRGRRVRPTLWWRLAWMRTFLSVSPERFAHIRPGYEMRVRQATGYGNHPRPKHGNDYYANNLNFGRLFVLCILEDEPRLREPLLRVLREMHRRTVDHLNPHFAAVYLLCTGARDDEEAQAVVQGMLLDFPEDTWDRVIDHRDDPAVPARDEQHTRYALLARQRPPRDFYWQRKPVVRYGGSERTLEFAPLDVILPYWMGRVAGAIPPPPQPASADVVGEGLDAPAGGAR